MQVAGIRRVGARVEMIEAGEPRPLAGDEVLLEVRAAGAPSPNHTETLRRISQSNWVVPKTHGVKSIDMNHSATAMIETMKGNSEARRRPR